jgi:hypothetical protein
VEVLSDLRTVGRGHWRVATREALKGDRAKGDCITATALERLEKGEWTNRLDTVNGNTERERRFSLIAVMESLFPGRCSAVALIQSLLSDRLLRSPF